MTKAKVDEDFPKNGGVGGVVVGSACMDVAIRRNFLLLFLPFEIQIIFVIS